MPVDHTKNIIEIKNVSFAYGEEPILTNVNLNIHVGDYLGIIGPNGGGKTTLLKIMLGLLKPTVGEVLLFGKKIKDFRDWPNLGYVAQKATSFDPLFPVTAREVVAMGRYAKKGLARRLDKNDEEKIDEALRQVEMFEERDRLIGDLSGGQRQRVFIARALSKESSVIFLDEPTVGVDVETQEKFYLLLRRLNRDLDLTLVLISHDIDVVTSEATEIACINQTLIYHGAPKEFSESEHLHKLYGNNIRRILHGH